MSKFSFCYHSVAFKKGKPMEGGQQKKQNENLPHQDTRMSEKKTPTSREGGCRSETKHTMRKLPLQRYR